jgi:two-component system, OmpR family, sensor histidine kinase KdpD
MQFVKAATPAFVAFAVVLTVTAVLTLVKHEAVGPQHLVFFYLLPTALVAVLYGMRTAMFCAFAATACAAFFLYDPVYSFYVATPVEAGELICFTGLALIGAKCTADLLRPVANFSRQNPAIED